MNYIYRTAFVLFTFVGLSGTSVSKAICSEVYSTIDGYNCCESFIHTVQAKTERGEVKTGVLKDPVCGMEVSNPEDAPSVAHEGMVYYFCSEKCMKKFKENPSAYTRKQ